MPRVIVFIDNSNVYKHLAALCEADKYRWCKQYDPLFLSEKLVGARELEKVIFYCAPPPQDLYQRDSNRYASQNTYYEKVRSLNNVDVKFAKLMVHDGALFEKNLDTQLTADVIAMAALNEYDHAIIVANDGDYVSAVEGAKQQGKKVEVAHFKRKFSMDLRQSADITRRLRPTYFRNIYTKSKNEQQSLAVEE